MRAQSKNYWITKQSKDDFIYRLTRLTQEFEKLNSIIQELRR